MTGYLIYHPKRAVAVFDNRFVHHDPPRGNQDPYVWNDPFLHTYCHMTQMRPEIGQTILWVSGNNWPAFDQLCCDLVFTVGAKLFWANSNHISPDDPIVDSPRAYDEHYRWAHQHPLQRRRRFTLKADQESFQPQNAKGELIDVVPALARWLSERAPVKLQGREIVECRAAPAAVVRAVRFRPPQRDANGLELVEVFTNGKLGLVVGNLREEKQWHGENTVPSAQVRQENMPMVSVFLERCLY